MSSKKEPSVAPIRRSVSVSWPQAEAYRRFTQDFAKWWPSFSYSIGGSRVKRVVFEPRADGRIYEEHKDGTRMRWGKVIALDPPRRIVFSFHPSRTESDAQHIEINFSREGDRTRVDLISTGWERMSDKAKATRGGYQLGWGLVLDRFAGRFRPVLLFFYAMSLGITLIGQRGKFIRTSLGKMED
jgi:uncharacterized protein YndB with AHSA1/START domain